MFSRVLVIVVVLAAIIGSVEYKIGVIKKKNAREEVTISAIQAKQGIPVYVSNVEYGKLAKQIKPTVKILGGDKASVILPADTRSFVERMKNAEIFIDGQRFVAYNGVFSPRSMDYTGFLEINVRLKPAPAWPVGTVKVGRAPYDKDQRYAYLPLSAIYRTAKGHSVYVIKDGHIHIKNISLLFSTDRFVAIAENGVKVGDQVVISDQRDLVEGQKVMVVENKVANN